MHHPSRVIDWLYLFRDREITLAFAIKITTKGLNLLGVLRRWRWTERGLTMGLFMYIVPLPPQNVWLEFSNVVFRLGYIRLFCKCHYRVEFLSLLERIWYPPVPFHCDSDIFTNIHLFDCLYIVYLLRCCIDVPDGATNVPFPLLSMLICAIKTRRCCS